MGRFSEDERAEIESRLVNEGKRKFAQFGFERTRIKDITEAVGIGTSTFYQFYDSKTDLYVEVLYLEREQLEERINEAVAAVDSQRAEVRTVLETLFEEVRTNPLISRLIIDDELRVVRAELSDAERESLSGLDDSFVDAWTESPDFRYDNPDVVRGIFQSLVFTTRTEEFSHDDEPALAHEVIERELIETIVAGLFTPAAAADAVDTDAADADAADDNP